MKKLYAITLLGFLGFCTPERVQDKQENVIVQAMVNGQWKVTNYKKGSADVTNDFSPYKFQFKENLTVDAINNGSVEQSGSWSADSNSQSITSNFNNSTNPVILLNGTWLITSTTWTSVNANQTVNGELRTLRLDKL